MKYLFISFAHGLLVPFWVYIFLIDIEVLHFWHIDPWLSIYIAGIFQFVSCLFTVFFFLYLLISGD